MATTILVIVIVLTISVYIATHDMPKITREISFYDIEFKQWAHKEDGVMPLDKPDPLPGGWYPWGKVSLVEFENGYGASVVRHYGSYGGDGGLYELAVMELIDDKWGLTFETEITNDVLGWLTEEDVTKFLREIEEL